MQARSEPPTENRGTHPKTPKLVDQDARFGVFRAQPLGYWLLEKQVSTSIQEPALLIGAQERCQALSFNAL